jgi:hypothetical protein
MRTAFVLPAAALAAIGFGLVSPPTAQAIPVHTICPPSLNLVPGAMQQCLAAHARAGLNPEGGNGPCDPNVAAGMNGTCGWQSVQPGTCALTGQCQGGIPSVEVPPMPH